jgi:hypothetical protein
VKRENAITTLLPILLLCLRGFVAHARGAQFDHTHSGLDRVFHRVVTEGLVDYASLKAAPGDLNAYLDELAAVSEADFKAWTQAQQLAFLINLYNTATLRLIVEHYPVKSIKKIGSLFKGPWDQPVVRVFRQTMTLDDLEHGILRPKYREPRVHFALVCAALGCPPLRPEAYVAIKLDAQLDDQGRKFVGDPAKNFIDARKQVVHLSPIFKWFAEDFAAKSGSMLKFVQPYFPRDAQAELAKVSYKIRYSDYDWSLNDLRK